MIEIYDKILICKDNYLRLLLSQIICAKRFFVEIIISIFAFKSKSRIQNYHSWNYFSEKRGKANLQPPSNC
jgi:hypothetical protein